MAIVEFLINLMGATMLLLFAVRMVRTGIERSYGASFERLMTARRNPFAAGLVGLVLAVILQSSAAVALLTSGFVSSGLLAFPAGLAIVLGGDLGSALIIQILSFRLDWLIPVLLAVGGWLFTHREGREARQLGRIIMGVALTLLSLRLLREAMDPIRDSTVLPFVAEYLARDFVTAFIVGAAMAFIMHSSVAAILMCVTLVQIGAMPFDAALSLVLGANLGSALIPVWLTRGMDAAARRVPYANLFVRGTWSVIILFAVNAAFQEGLFAVPDGAQMLVTAHVAFNLSLLLVVLPFRGYLQAPVEKLLPSPMKTFGLHGLVRPVSFLDPIDIGSPSQAIASLKRELLRMSDLVTVMFRPTIDLYRSGDETRAQSVRELDGEVNRCLSGIREFVAALPSDDFSKTELRAARDMVEYAIRLETAGDVVAKRLTVVATGLNASGAKFSKEGWKELETMHRGILSNLKLASNVLISDDLESARLLNLEKTEIKRAERESRQRHLKRLQDGSRTSLETSDAHLETLQAFREFNSHIAAVAMPILYANGQLLETRLVEDMPASSMKA